MNIEQIKQFLTVLDLPSGVIMTIVTLTVLAVSTALVLHGRDVPATFLTMYGLIVGPFCVHKTTVAMKSSETTTTSQGGTGESK